ncbi:hypothetical protein [Jidongwangia harbinensis]|uniref:hypothetical protein n=1 Tax=Jidongwangia harbinensis TaxID=2878561 RepID=UPI001CD9FF33|nr:hypothetical protein [Jidongwangia harbinensis]MCA2216976.1 hypothetical protein [Jidongwangia harbinensis]
MGRPVVFGRNVPVRRTRGSAAVLAGLLLATLPAAGPAWAHDTRLKLEVAGDGATGVTVRARHADGHPLDKPVRLVLTATAAGGRTVGPRQLEPAGEGQGFYASGPVLAPGSWRVTVSAPRPYTGETAVEVRARAAQSAPAQAAPVSAARRTAAGESGWRWWPVGLAVLAALAIVTLVVPVVRRRTKRV